jgi:hypothetical protein
VGCNEAELLGNIIALNEYVRGKERFKMNKLYLTLQKLH